MTATGMNTLLTDVGVLILVWEADDVFVGRPEVPTLRDAFGDDFGFTTEVFDTTYGASPLP